MIRHPAAIIAIDTSNGDRWGHHIFCQVGGQGVIACRYVAWLDLGNEALWVSPEAEINEPFDPRCGQGLTQHAQDMPLPVLIQRLIRQIIQMHPALVLHIPAAAGGDEVQVGIVLTITSMGM